MSPVAVTVHNLAEFIFFLVLVVHLLTHNQSGVVRFFVTSEMRERRFLPFALRSLLTSIFDGAASLRFLTLNVGYVAARLFWC